MPLTLDNVGKQSDPGRNSWTSKDALLYALGVGAGQIDPTGFELEFTTENSSFSGVEQRVLPTMPVVVAMGGGDNAPGWGTYDFPKLLHAEQGVTLHGAIPADGEVETVQRLVRIYDKGKAAIVRLENVSTYGDSGKPAFRTRFAAYIRDEGGGGTADHEATRSRKMP